jgi:preprotein translocase subunit SecG
MITLIRFLLGFMLVLTSLFLILLVLIQRGRGGGLTGALGGAGGQSAFGTKAGDVFTRITVGVAAFWIGLCIVAINVLGRQQSLFAPGLGGAAPQAVAPQTPLPSAPAQSGDPAAPAGNATAPAESGAAPTGGAPAPTTSPASTPADASPPTAAPAAE